MPDPTDPPGFNSDPTIPQPISTDPSVMQGVPNRSAASLADALGNPSVPTIEEAKRILQTYGVDVTAPEILQLLASDTFRQSLRIPGNSLPGSLAAVYPSATGPGSATEYAQALTTFNLEPPTTSGGRLLGDVWPRETIGAPNAAFTPNSDGFYQDPGTGALMFKNGVIVDPNGQVIMPPGKNVPGSLMWLRDVENNWSSDKVKEWRAKLVKAGYLPKGSEKQKGWSVELKSALVEYETNRYANGGKPVVKEGTQAGPTAVPLKPLRPVLEEEVRRMIASTYGELPNEADVQHWTDFVQQHAMHLQRAKSLTPGTAIQAAEARGQQYLRNSPMGQYAQDTEENTALRDAITNSVHVFTGLA